ncbi:MAG: acetyl-CoA carboxylase biotin carboxyl carrier protein [Clostridia bacterium]|nr:acetyl-CoA carboxylase biotin carboxyl carrier protein [Clostridia bacterium]
MEYEKIKQLMEDMGNSKLTTLDIDFPDGTKISMKKEFSNGNSCEKNIIENNEEYVNTEETIVNKEIVGKETENKKIIKAPMVGTFYLKPSPTSDPYVEVGKNVNIGDTVCIIEAMKLMNEIESDVSGKIVEILVKDGEPVEYGMPLFSVE